jgi:predicted NAD/FAD-binding protein
LHWNAHAADAAKDPQMKLGTFLDTLGLGQAFRDWYLGPISGAIWSTPSADMMDYPAEALVRFFQNHKLLQAKNQHQWYTVVGGSAEYVRRLEAELRRVGVDIRTSAALTGVRRVPGGAEIRQGGDEWQIFDEVVFACHADEALALLSDATPDEQAALGSVRFQANHTILHRDAGQMPSRRICWSAWNYREGPKGPEGVLGLTYWMNRLQPIPQDDPMFVTLNPSEQIREEAIYDQKTFMHPVFDLAMARGVGALKAMNGTQNTWFCGAWMRNGFHEDGYATAVAVAKGLARRDTLADAA